MVEMVVEVVSDVAADALVGTQHTCGERNMVLVLTSVLGACASTGTNTQIINRPRTWANAGEGLDFAVL